MGPSGVAGATSIAGSEAGSDAVTSPLLPHDGSPSLNGKPHPSWRPLIAWPPVRQASPHVKQAAAMLDRACLMGGELIGLYPGARVGVAGYLVVVHLVLWALFFMRHRQCAS